MQTLWIISAYAGGVLYAGAFSMASVVDLQCREIPDLCGVMLLAAAGLRILSGDMTPGKALAGLLGMGCLLLVLATVTDAMGGGDVKLAAAACASIGMQNGFYSMIGALSLALLFAGIQQWITKKRSREIPLAPFLMGGFCCMYFTNG